MQEKIIRRTLDHFDSEIWHTWVRDGFHLLETIPGGLKVAEFFFAAGHRIVQDRRLAFTLSHNVSQTNTVPLENRLTVAAGWDKVGVTCAFWPAVGAAGTSVGAVLERAQLGRDKPRQWYWDGKAFNRLGFNSPGMDVVAQNLERYRDHNVMAKYGDRPGFYLPIGINVGINADVKPADAPKAFAAVVRRLWVYTDWFEINVSSPNTTDLRLLQDPIYLRDIDQEVLGVMDEEIGCRKPIYHKVAPFPDLSPAATKGVIRVTLDNRLSGMISANTTADSRIKGKYDGKKGRKWSEEQGGLSGDDPEYRSNVDTQVAFIRQEVKGVEGFEIISAGGINSFKAALRRVKAGANVLQINTGIGEKGPMIFGQINRDWIAWMDREGIKRREDLDQLVGLEAKNYTTSLL